MSSTPVVESRRPTRGRVAGCVALLALASWALGAFAAFPLTLSGQDAAVLKIAFKHVAAFEREGPGRSPEEIEKLPRHMRPQNPERSRTGKRLDTLLSVELDGHRLVEKTYRPGGLRHDGPTFAYEELAVPPGRHRLKVALADGNRGGESRRPWKLEKEIEIRRGQLLLVEFSDGTGLSVR
jgi:hypothetical protein